MAIPHLFDKILGIKPMYHNRLKILITKYGPNIGDNGKDASIQKIRATDSSTN